MLSRATNICPLIAALLLSGVLAIPAQAQVADSVESFLNRDQLRDYRRQRLSVKIKTRRQRSVEITGQRYQDVFGRTVTQRTVQQSGDTYKEWIPYKGLDRTTEVDFFKTAGYPDLAREARDYHTYTKSAINNSGAAFAFGIGGAGLIFTVLGAASDGESARRGRNVGLGFLGAGVLIGVLDWAITPGGERYEVGPPMRYPASQVSGIAGEYNQQLYRKLREAQPTTKRNQPSTNTQRRAEFPAQTTTVDQAVQEALSLPAGARKVNSSKSESLQEGDVIISIDRTELRQEDALNEVVNRHSPGDTLQMEILREGDNKTVSVTLRGSIDR